MNKGLITAIILIASLSGCAAIEQKAADYEEAATCYGRPDKVVICWRRENQARQGFEARCCGENCHIPQCPTDGS